MKPQTPSIITDQNIQNLSFWKALKSLDIGVASLNTLTGDITLVAGSGITITISGQDIIISSSGGGGGGTVTSFSFTNANGFAGTVTNPTTVPDLTLDVDGTHYLPTTTDESNWNAKQPAGSYITDLTGDVTATGPGSVSSTIANNAVITAKIAASAVTLSKLQNAVANSILLGSGASGSGSPYTELTLGANLSITGTTLNAAGGGSGTVTTTGSPVSGNLTKFSGATSITNGDLSGDVTTSGTLAASVVKVNGSAVPTSQAYVGTNGSGQIIAATTPATAGRLIGVQTITATGGGTYTPTGGTNSIIIQLVGGGGGSGGVATASSGQVSVGQAAGGGGFVQKRLNANFSGASYSVGAGGTAGASGNNAGGNGGNTTFTTTGGSPVTYTAGGGIAGVGGGTQPPPVTATPAPGGTATNGDINIPGGASFTGTTIGTTTCSTGNGGSSIMSGSTTGQYIASGTGSAGIAGLSFGGGASPAGASNGGTAKAGAVGGNGILIIYEYS